MMKFYGSIQFCELVQFIVYMCNPWLQG